eukprot:scaffold68678_cov45-Phaeocystis_antarctica.AAC.2
MLLLRTPVPLTLTGCPWSRPRVPLSISISLPTTYHLPPTLPGMQLAEYPRRAGHPSRLLIRRGRPWALPELRAGGGGGGAGRASVPRAVLYCVGGVTT